MVVVGALALVGVLGWQAMAQSGVPDPTARHLTPQAVVLDSSILVLREGLEAILVLAALAASMLGVNQERRRPLAAGAALALLASLLTWFAVVAMIRLVDAPELDVQAVTGLLAVAVLVVIMNWFFHRVYWTGWIGHHHGRKRRLLAEGAAGRQVFLGLALLGFTAVYREGFEVVLFLQNLRLQAGDMAVAEGVLIALVLLAAAAYLTMAAHHKLPYKRMLVLTGVMLGTVFVVMVGESAQELQQAGWLSTTPLPIPIPDWTGVWFALFPNLEGLAAQVAAAVVVIGSYYAAEYLLVKRPRAKGLRAAMRPESVPIAGE
jgi:high-affinity iron transporter